MIALTKVVYDLGFGVLWRVVEDDDYQFPVYVVRENDKYRVVDLAFNGPHSLKDMKKHQKIMNRAFKILDKYLNDPEKAQDLMDMRYGDSIEIKKWK